MHEITPYSEVYGIHPRDFHFKRSSQEAMLCHAAMHNQKASPTDCDTNDSDDEEDEEELVSLRAKALDFLTHGRGHRSVFRRPCYFALGAILVMIRMFGTQVCAELVNDALSLPKEAGSGLLEQIGFA